MAEVTEYGIKEEKSGQLSLILEPVDETNDEFTESLLTNEKLLNMHKHGRKAKEISNKDDMVIWKSQTKDGKVYVAVFNIGKKENSAKLKFKDLDLDKKEEYSATDIWENVRYTIKDKKEITLKPHSVVCYEIEA